MGGGECPPNGDIVNGIHTSAGSGSPEDEALREIANKYADREGLENPRMFFFDGDLEGFMELLDSIVDEHGHLDSLFIGEKLIIRFPHRLR